jgi:hypothetical protein
MEIFMKTILLRWGILISFVAMGTYCLLGSIQSASFSVPADPLLSEIYKTRAILLLPVAILMFSSGVLFFINLKDYQKPFRRRGRSIEKE